MPLILAPPVPGDSATRVNRAGTVIADTPPRGRIHLSVISDTALNEAFFKRRVVASRIPVNGCIRGVPSVSSVRTSRMARAEGEQIHESNGCQRNSVFRGQGADEYAIRRPRSPKREVRWHTNGP